MHTPTQRQKNTKKNDKNRKRIGYEGEPRINLLRAGARARAHTHTNLYNTKKRVETQYTRNSNSHANVHPFTRKVKRENK